MYKNYNINSKHETTGMHQNEYRQKAMNGPNLSGSRYKIYTNKSYTNT